MTTRPKLGALAVCHDAGRFLLVQRAKAPDAGFWGFPGGHVEWGETVMMAATRELHEETGITATPQRILDWGEALTRDIAGDVTHHFVLAAVLLSDPAGTAIAADDACAVKWATLAEIDTLQTSARVAQVARRALSSL